MMCDFLYRDPFLTDPLVTSCTAHKNISLLRAFQDVCVTAGIVQFYAAWMKYLVALLWHPWGKMFPERWICCPSLLLSADTPKHKYPVGRCLLVELSPRGLGMPKNENTLNPPWPWCSQTWGASWAPPACGSAGGAAEFCCSGFRISCGLSLAGLLLSHSLPSSHANTCYGHSQGIMFSPRCFWTFFTSLVPEMSFPVQGRFFIQFQVLCFAEIQSELTDCRIWSRNVIKYQEYLGISQRNRYCNSQNARQ